MHKTQQKEPTFGFGRSSFYDISKNEAKYQSWKDYHQG